MAGFFAVEEKKSSFCLPCTRLLEDSKVSRGEGEGLKEAFQRPARGLPEACQRPARGLPEACQTFGLFCWAFDCKKCVRIMSRLS